MSTTVTIPESVTHDHAFAYGYLTSMMLLLGDYARNTDENNIVELQYLLKQIKKQAALARELDAEMSRRADERMERIINA